MTTKIAFQAKRIAVCQAQNNSHSDLISSLTFKAAICVILIPCLSLSSSLFLAEIEAVEACKWLRAAGFPQYAQMYEGKLHALPSLTILIVLYIVVVVIDVTVLSCLTLAVGVAMWAVDN